MIDSFYYFVQNCFEKFGQGQTPHFRHISFGRKKYKQLALPNCTINFIYNYKEKIKLPLPEVLHVWWDIPPPTSMNSFTDITDNLDPQCTRGPYIVRQHEGASNCLELLCSSSCSTLLVPEFQTQALWPRRDGHSSLFLSHGYDVLS